LSHIFFTDALTFIWFFLHLTAVALSRKCRGWQTVIL